MSISTKGSFLIYLTLQACILAVSAESEQAIPDWTKYPFFFVGAAVIASIGWLLLCCCCIPCTGLKFKLVILILTCVLVALWGYTMFGPWWDKINVKS